MHGNEIVQYLQNYKRHEFDQGHSRKLLQSSTSYIQIENTKTTCLLLKTVEFCSTFDIQIDITLAIFREKLQDHTNILSKHANIHINRATHYEIMAL